MDSFSMKQVSITPSLICNLKCRLCAPASPFCVNAKPMSIERLKETADRYFDVVDHVDKFAVGGGEPMIYPQIAEFIEYMGKYSDKTDLIEIITNGTVIPKDDFLSAAQALGNKFRILVDNYGEHLSKKVDDIDILLTKANIKHEIRNYTSEDPHCGGWVDFGDLSQKKHNDAEAKALYSKCAYPQKMKFCFNIVDGVMYPCSPVRRCREIGVADNSNNYVDLFDDTLSIAQKRSKISGIYNGDCLSACSYCNGMCDDSPRFTPAQQLTPEEILQIRGR